MAIQPFTVSIGIKLKRDRSIMYTSRTLIQACCLLPAQIY